MRRFFVAVTLCLLSGITMYARQGNFVSTVSPHAEHAAARHLEGVIILKLRADAPNVRSTTKFRIPVLDVALADLGFTERRPMFPLAPYPAPLYKSVTGSKGYERVYVLSIDPGQDIYRAIERLRATGMVEYAEPYYTFDLYYTPNDPMIGEQYALDIIKARQAWDVIKGDRSITIAICDDGVDVAHEDLAPNLWSNVGEIGADGMGNDKRTNGVDDDANGFVDDWRGWDFVGHPLSIQDIQARRWNPDNDPTPRRLAVSGYAGFHGTWVAGAAAAVADNGLGVAGTAFNASIIPVKAASDSLAANSVVAGYDAIRYAADLGADIITCSFGAGAPRESVRGLQEIVDYARERGSLVIAAAGNTGSNNDRIPHYPADLDGVLAVGATGSDDLPTDFSGYGVAVDLYAPGVEITTTDVGGGYVSANVTGTSFSTPITAGIAALVALQHPDWTPDQIAAQLRSTGDRIVVSDPRLGPLYFRRLNAERAVTINSDLAPGGENGLPGVAMISRSVVAGSNDTLRNLNDSVRFRLRLRNYLAPTRNLRIEGHRNGEVVIDGPIEIGAMGTLDEREIEVTARLDPDARLLYTDEQFQLVLRLVDGDYEDYVAVMIPVNPPGWRQQIDPLTFLANDIYVGSGIHAVTPRIAWAIGNTPVGQETLIPFSTRNVSGTGWSDFRQIVVNGIPSQEPLFCLTAADSTTAWAGSGLSGGRVGIFRTTDGGARWERADVASITPFVNCIHFWDKLHGIFIGDQRAGNWGIGRTTDGGVTWNPLPQPLRAANAQEAGWTNSLAVVGDTIWFGSNQSRIWRSTDRGETWSRHATPGLNVSGVAFANGMDGMATFSVVDNVSGVNMVAASRDGGITWSAVSLPFPDAEPQSVTAVPGTTRFFVATQRGVFETSDFGTRWHLMAMPRMQLSSIILSTAIDTANRELASFGTNYFSQLMRYVESLPEPVDTTATAAPATIAGTTQLATLREILPNPLGGEDASVTFVLSRTARTRLTLVDLGGRTVRVLHDGELEAGEHRAQITTSGLAAGAYLLRLEAEGTAVTRRVIVLQ